MTRWDRLHNNKRKTVHVWITVITVLKKVSTMQEIQHHGQKRRTKQRNPEEKTIHESLQKWNNQKLHKVQGQFITSNKSKVKGYEIKKSWRYVTDTLTEHDSDFGIEIPMLTSESKNTKKGEIVHRNKDKTEFETKLMKMIIRKRDNANRRRNIHRVVKP